MAVGPGGVGLVAGFVVGVGLGPVGGVDGGDAAGAVEVEGAAAGVGVVDRGEVAVGAVGVAAVEDPLGFGGRRVLCPDRAGGGLESAGGCCGEGLGGEATGWVQTWARLRFSSMVRVSSWPAASWSKVRMWPAMSRAVRLPAAS